MKKFLLGMITSIVLISLTAFTINSFESNSMAQVSQFSGYYIFTDCKPVNEYDYIGTVKANEVQVNGDISFSYLTYDQLKENLINIANKKIRKGKMKEGDAIIINTANETGDIIKFKAK